MDCLISTITVYFEDPFWVGLCEREWNGYYEVCKITFGPEPNERQVNDYMLEHWGKLKFTTPLKEQKQGSRQVGFKKRQREIRKQLEKNGVGTKSQQVLQRQNEQNKIERKISSRQEREAQKEQQFIQKMYKKKKKHRGH